MGDSLEISWAFRQEFRGSFRRVFSWERRREFRGGFVGVSWELSWSFVRTSKWEFGFQDGRSGDSQFRKDFRVGDRISGREIGRFAVPTLFSESASLTTTPFVKRLEPLSFAVGE